jgi:SAM-dependent methyltransferase
VKLVRRFVEESIEAGPARAIVLAAKWILGRRRTAIGEIERGVSGQQVHPSSQKHSKIIPLPTIELLRSVGSPSVEQFLMVGDVWAQLLKLNIAEVGATVMDIGVGCGRIARFMVNDPRIKKFIGFDVIEENIQWCNNSILPACKHAAEFLRFDIYSKEYNPTGRMRANEIRFPAEDAEVDLIFAASVFTHLLEPDFFHYLMETSRVLKVGGVAIFSAHCLPQDGMRFSGNERRIDISEEYFEEMAGRAGLRVQNKIKEFYGQDVFIFKK